MTTRQYTEFLGYRDTSYSQLATSPNNGIRTHHHHHHHCCWFSVPVWSQETVWLIHCQRTDTSAYTCLRTLGTRRNGCVLYENVPTYGARSVTWWFTKEKKVNIEKVGSTGSYSVRVRGRMNFYTFRIPDTSWLYRYATYCIKQVKSSQVVGLRNRVASIRTRILSFLFFVDRLKHLEFIYGYFKSSSMETIDRIKVDHMRAESVQWKDIATDQKVSYSTLLRWRNSIQYVDPEPLVASNWR